MAIDTRAKRCSALATRRLPWFRRFIPAPDATIAQGDRQQIGYVYSGILAGALQLPTYPIIEGVTYFEVIQAGTTDFRAVQSGSADFADERGG